MHSENLRNAAAWLEGVVDLFEEPQAAIVTAQPKAATAIRRHRPCLPGVSVVVALRISLQRCLRDDP
jgi:hypothetical protein